MATSPSCPALSLPVCAAKLSSAAQIYLMLTNLAAPDRYIALQNNAQGEGPLKEYFKGETLHHSVDAEWVSSR